METGKPVRAGTEKALRSVVNEPGGRVDVVADKGLLIPFHPTPKTNKTFSGEDARTHIVVLYMALSVELNS